MADKQPRPRGRPESWGTPAGRIRGGLAKVPKGFATMTPDQRRAAALKGAATRRARAEERKRAEEERRQQILNQEER